MEVGTNSKFAILKCNTKVHLHQTPDTYIEREGSNGALETDKNNDEITVNAGALIKIFEAKTSSINEQTNCVSTNFSTVQVLDLVNCMPIYENLYECPQDNLRPVHERLWPYVISIADPEQRLRLVENSSHCKWLLQYLRENSIAIISGEMFNKTGIDFSCIIRYIGPVVELYPVGYFFAVEILDLKNGYSPQADKIEFANKYTNCHPTLSIITTANWISEIPKEQQKKFSPFSLINETLEKVRSAIAPSSSVTGSVASNTLTQRRNKKAKQNKTPSAQFYNHIEDTTNSCINKSKNNNNDNDNNNANDYTHRMERGKKGSFNISSFECEEYRQSIENREKSIERRATSTNTAQTQTQSHGGILKNKHRDQSKSPNGPEIVVIGKADIDKSTRQESDVIVVDKASKCVDLLELLGKERSLIVGDTTTLISKQKLLNSNTSSCNSTANSTSNKSNRNKSTQINPTSYSACKNVKTLNDSNAAEFLQSPILDSDFMKLSSVLNTSLGLESMVEVSVPESDEALYGVIRWIGTQAGTESILIGVELEDDYIGKPIVTTNGGYKGISYFKCPAGRGIFVTSDRCSIDRRFFGAADGSVDNATCESNDNTVKNSNGLHEDQQTFGHMECPVVPGAVAPIKCSSLNALEELCGKSKGIQGHHNSCYLDVTLFSMFAFTPVFDAILYRPPEKDDICHYTEVQTVLREEIVNPLRKHMFVRADRVMKLRHLLDKFSSVSGLTSEEKDPEEFLSCLLSQIMKAEPFLKLNSGHDAYYYQLFVEKDERLSFPSVQQLFEQSFYASDIKLKEVPSCLIIQMPRFGKNFKMYPRILPSQVLDVTDIIHDSPRQCSVCGKLAEFECRGCFGVLQSGIGLENTSFCKECLETVHRHVKRANHKHRKLSVPQDFRVMVEQMTVPRLYMELFAVVCIETSHYVAFVKSGSGPDAPWCFFDSMADRKGEQNGYNIPEMITVPDLPKWLSDDGARTVHETSSNDKMLPEHAKRLFCDAYMCMYQSTDVMMYR